MYMAKITNLEEASNIQVSTHKVGDIIEFADYRLRYLRRWVKPLEHYRMITTTKKRCKHCGNWIIKRKKKILNIGGDI